MKKNLGWFVLSLAVFGGTAVRAESLLEIRGGAGIVASDPKAFNEAVKNDFGDGLDSGDFSNYNVDVFFNIPVLPIGVGIRQEWLNDSQGNGVDDWEIDVKNLSLLVDLRLLDNDLFYVGPIMAIGYPSGDLKISGGKSNLDKSQISYSLAGEAGLKLGRFILAAEAGYSSLELEHEDSSTKVDLSGFYGKAMVGIGLF